MVVARHNPVVAHNLAEEGRNFEAAHILFAAAGPHIDQQEGRTVLEAAVHTLEAVHSLAVEAGRHKEVEQEVHRMAVGRSFAEEAKLHIDLGAVEGERRTVVGGEDTAVHRVVEENLSTISSSYFSSWSQTYVLVEDQIHKVVDMPSLLGGAVDWDLSLRNQVCEGSLMG